MAITHSQVYFGEISETPWLSSRPFTCNYVQKELPIFLSDRLHNEYALLGSKNFRIRSGEYIPESSYEQKETKYRYLSVRNFSDFEVDLDDASFLNEIEGKKYVGIALEDEDIVITRSATVGHAHIFNKPDDNIYIPSHHLSVLTSDHSLDFKQFCVYWLKSKECREFFEAYATGKIQKEITNWSIRKIPVPKIGNISKIVRRCNEINDDVVKRKSLLIPLQTIIDNVLSEKNIKPKHRDSLFETLESHLSSIKNQPFLRCGAQYRAFWDKHDGLLFNGIGDSNQTIRLRYLLKPLKTANLKKGMLDEEHILIELEDIESGTGRIINEDKVTNVIGSDKIAFGECDLLTSKIDPYLGYTILNNPSKEYIGTTELLPFRVDKTLAYPEFVKYLLLSYEYLEKSSLLMYGKRHPRIHILDLLNIKVPCPKLEVQDIIIREIKMHEQRNNELQSQIEELKAEISKVILEAVHKQSAC